MPFSESDFQHRFANDDACLAFLFHLQHKRTTCTACGRTNAFHRHHAKRCYTCNCGRSQIYPQKGTLLEGSPLSPRLWFWSIYREWQCKGQLTAKQLERELHVSYPTAWKMLKRIRQRSRTTTTQAGGHGFPSLLSRVLIDR